MSSLQIIGAPQSNYVCTARLACAYKGVAHDVIPARPHSPEIDAIHPAGLIPVLRHGDVTLFEAKAICAYVDRAFPGPALQPADALGFARVEQWVSYINTSFTPICMVQYVQSYFFRVLPDGSPNRPLIDAALPKLEYMLGVLDKAIAPTGRLVGDGVTIADFFLLPMIFYLRKLPEGTALIAGLPALSAYCDKHLASAAFVSVAPPPMPGR